MPSNYLNRVALDTDTQLPKTGIVVDSTSGEVGHTMNVYGAVQALEATVGVAGTGGTVTPTNVGDILVCTASGATMWRSQDLFARKTANESVTSSTAFQDDDHLTLTVEANVIYEMIAFIIYDGATAGDLKTTWSAPAGATLDWTPTGLLTSATVASGSLKMSHSTLPDNESVGTIGTGVGNRTVMRPTGLLVVGGTAGSFTFRWAQLTSDVTATTVLANSYLRLKRVA